MWLLALTSAIGSSFNAEKHADDDSVTISVYLNDASALDSDMKNKIMTLFTEDKDTHLRYIGLRGTRLDYESSNIGRLDTFFAGNETTTTATTTTTTTTTTTNPPFVSATTSIKKNLKSITFERLELNVHVPSGYNKDMMITFRDCKVLSMSIEQGSVTASTSYFKTLHSLGKNTKSSYSLCDFEVGITVNGGEMDLTSCRHYLTSGSVVNLYESANVNMVDGKIKGISKTDVATFYSNTCTATVTDSMIVADELFKTDTTVTLKESMLTIKNIHFDGDVASSSASDCSSVKPILSLSPESKFVLQDNKTSLDTACISGSVGTIESVDVLPEDINTPDIIPRGVVYTVTVYGRLAVFDTNDIVEASKEFLDIAGYAVKSHWIDYLDNSTSTTATTTTTTTTTTTGNSSYLSFTIPKFTKFHFATGDEHTVPDDRLRNLEEAVKAKVTTDQDSKTMDYTADYYMHEQKPAIESKFILMSTTLIALLVVIITIFL